MLIQMEIDTLQVMGHRLVGYVYPTQKVRTSFAEYPHPRKINKTYAYKAAY